MLRVALNELHSVSMWGGEQSMSAAIQHDGRADRAGLAKRHGILRAARELFATSGYDETTIAAIAQAAGVAVGTVYRYFANKHEILMDVYLAFNAEITQVLQSSAILELPPQQAPR